GHGYRPAEADQVSFHGAALPPMSVVAPAPPPVSGDGDATLSAEQAAAARGRPPNYTAVAVAELIDIARDDPRVVAITAGMPTGTGLNRFGAAFPGRMFDVGIAEQHAVTMATGLAMGGLRPYVAIYSTFLQRAFDQTVHDVCQNDQPVVLGVDRAGLVGEDGTSHQGMFTIPAQRQLPNLVVASPKDEQELRRLLRTAFGQDHPFALHYPRDAGFDLPAVTPDPIPVGEGEVLREGRDLLIVGFGPIVMHAVMAADRLEAAGWSVGVINARYAKPLDARLILEHAQGRQLVVTVEESVVTGGFGSAVLEALAEAGLTDAALRALPIKVIGLPAERFVEHGSVGDLRRLLRLDVDGLHEQLLEALAAVAARPTLAATTGAATAVTSDESLAVPGRRAARRSA
ncbi:MAG: transketolase C-terminal domain-containing protein, partial [Candidatus Limnocylindrales bacterium]